MKSILITAAEKATESAPYGSTWPQVATIAIGVAAACFAFWPFER